MAGDDGGGAAKELDQTPTWAVATVCAVFIVISIILEKVIHRVGKWFMSRRKMGLFEALEKVKGELMVLGFISLLLTFSQTYIAKICIPIRAAHTMLPCSYREEAHNHHEDSSSEEHHRRLLWNERRFLAGGSSPPECAAVSLNLPFFPVSLGHEQLISANGLHQLHIFIFFLAISHVVYSAATMMLGRLKLHLVYASDFTGLNDARSSSSGILGNLEINGNLSRLYYPRLKSYVSAVVRPFIEFFVQIRGWKEWERETRTQDYEFSNVAFSISLKCCRIMDADTSRFRLTHETSFVRGHNSVWARIPVLVYVYCFFRQFFRSVTKADYLTMRHGFIVVHMAPGSKFDFQKYIKRSLEDDFKVVVGVSPLLWGTVVLYLLLNVHGWQAMFWASLIPLIVILAVGTKLQRIMMKMALEIQERHAVVQGIPIVQYEFKLKSCFHENLKLVIIRVVLGVAALVLCSYITLPLYALVTQMGSTMKKSIFDEQTSKALRKWRQAARKKTKEGRSPRSSNASPMQSPLHTLHRFMTTGHSMHSSTISRRRSDHDLSDLETDEANLILHMEESDMESSPPPAHQEVHALHSDEEDFSFVKPTNPLH
ncbi:hypothetical protein Sjap_017593 [Stephania japonica]|uniref:MLO-like protein n=1 Tax=Stephania japonica TaxID=461633 RepID=A0AAP0I6L1_9MAGN